MTAVMVDAASLGDASSYRGIGTYVRQLLTGLAEDGRFEVTALSRPGTALPPGVGSITLRRAAPGRFVRAEHELLLPLDLLRGRASVFHSPALDPPWRTPCAWVQTLHDVIPLVFDDPTLAAERRRWHRHAQRLRRAHSVIAISRHTADLGIAKLGLDPRRVEVVPHGVGSAFVPATDRGDDDPPYILSVGEYSPRKGYPEAFAVVGELAARGHPHRLHVTGRIAPWLREAIDALVRAAPRPDRIDLLGYVEDVVAQYQRAAVLICTSRYEGFGLPVLEAMACGTPVVAFANSSLVEVVADAGVLVPDGDVVAMATAVRALLKDPTRCEDLTQRGLERARELTWERSVAAHAEIYSSAAAR